MVSNGLPTLLLRETVWLDAHRYEEAERQYHEFCAKEKKRNVNPASVVNPKMNSTSCGMPKSSLACEIANARQKIQNFLKSGDVKTAYTDVSSLQGRVEKLEKEINETNKQLVNLYSKYVAVELKFSSIEKLEKELEGLISHQRKLKTGGHEVVQNGPPDDDDVDDLDLFGSDEEDDDAIKLKEDRLKAYANKKAKKPALVAKSSVVLDVKPWDDETDMKAMEEAVRNITSDGLVWGASKLVPLAYGIKKLQIVAIVEDEKVSVDWLQDTIQAVEDLVQSVDIAAFNKL